MRLSSTVAVLCSVFPALANAETAEEAAPAPAAPPTAAEVQPAAPPAPAAVAPAPAPEPAPEPAAATAPAPIVFGWEALVDAYYMVNFTGSPKTQAPKARQFDTTANNLALNYAKLGVHADTSWVTLRMDLGVGHTAAIINAGSQGASDASSADTASMYGNGFLVQQAFAQLKPHPMISIDAGRFVTSAGAEVIEANKNWLYSRSLLFFGIPLLHTGLRINIAPLGTIAAPELLVSLQLVNGWNNDPDLNSDKTFGANVTYTPANLGLTAAATTYMGKEAPGADTTVLVDGVFLKDIGPVSVGANLDYLKTGDLWWFGGAGMGRFLVNDYFNLAARFEYLYSKNQGYGGTGASGLLPAPEVASSASLYEITGQAAFTMDKHYELRLEVRADLSDKEVFAKGGTARKNQVTGLLAALAYF